MIKKNLSKLSVSSIESRPVPTGRPQTHHTIQIKSYQLLKQLLAENTKLSEILKASACEKEVLNNIKNWVLTIISEDSLALQFYHGQVTNRGVSTKLQQRHIAAIRLLDYVDHNDMTLTDPNLRGEKVTSNPLTLLWAALKKSSSIIHPDFLEDMIYLFRQLDDVSTASSVHPQKLQKWSDRFPSGLNPVMIQQREENRKRILNHIIDKIDRGEKKDPKYRFEKDLTRDQKLLIALDWWKERLFHLRFAVRNPVELNQLLDNSLGEETMQILSEAAQAGIPFFINPYYLSLLQIQDGQISGNDDRAIRDYILYSKPLVEEFGRISAWEKEDICEAGQPNAAGWITPGDNIYRRYPEVAILIPDTQGRACGGLCSTCQRMYGFQKGNLNFDLDRLSPKQSWQKKLENLMDYFENDSQLRDVLITGGDAFMSSNRSLREILQAVYEMAKRKQERNEQRDPENKHAEITRIRLGTRLPVYLPQRVTPELLEILSDFKAKASRVGIQQFVIQTHFVSPLEVTPEAREAIEGLLNAGWMVTNQLVFTTASSRRGHAAKLRQVLNRIGVLSYYTFSVKGFMENSTHFATNARIVQEQMEEKAIGAIPENARDAIRELASHPEKMVSRIRELQESLKLPFLSSDRSVLNMPGVGKSLTFRVVGMTADGRRILKFEHDPTRKHTPLIQEMGAMMIIESKTISAYLRQMQEMGENPQDYEGLYGYSVGETEDRMPIFDYPQSNLPITEKLTNFRD